VLLNSISNVSKAIALPNEILTRANEIEEGVVLTIGAGDIDRLIDPISNILGGKIK
jgi:hypothetical protein